MLIVLSVTIEKEMKYQKVSRTVNSRQEHTSEGVQADTSGQALA